MIENEITKKEFQDSKKPLSFVISVNPKTGEFSRDLLEGDGSWMVKMIEQDFPERIVFIKRNKEAFKIYRKAIQLFLDNLERDE